MMAYKQKFAVAIKSNGRILREIDETVFIPFGSEYSIVLKNLNSIRSIVNIFVDGTNIVDGGLVVNAGQEIDLQRSIINGNLQKGNALKFIERTSNIEQHRGVKLEDGIVRVEFQFEKPYVQPTWGRPDHEWYGPVRDRPSWQNNPLRSMGTGDAPPWGNGQITCSATYSANAVSNGTISPASVQSKGFAAPANETGITVAGSESNQKFQTASWFQTEAEKHCIVLKLLGQTPDNEDIRKPITVKAKQKCPTCGRTNRATSKFCAECGTALEIFGDNTSRPILKVL